MPQPARIGVPGPELTGRQVRRHRREVERAGVAELDRRLVHARVAGQPAGHLVAGAQVRRAGRRQPAGELVQAGGGPRCREHLGEVGVGRAGVVDVVGRDDANADPAREAEEHVVALVVERLVMVDELDEDILAAEHADQPPQLALGAGRALGGQRRRDHALAAAGQDRPLALMRARQFVQVVDRPALGAAQLRRRDGAAQPGVPVGVAGEHQQVAALRIGDAGLPRGQAEAQLGAEHGLDPHPGGRLGEPDHPVHAVVVGDRQHLDPQPDGLGHQGVRVRRPVEEAVRRVTVQLGPGHRPGGGGGSLLRPAVAPARRGRDVSRPPGQPPFELPPRDRRVVPTHDRARQTGPTGSGSRV